MQELHEKTTLDEHSNSISLSLTILNTIEYLNLKEYLTVDNPGQVPNSTREWKMRKFGAGGVLGFWFMLK